MNIDEFISIASMVVNPTPEMTEECKAFLTAMEDKSEDAYDSLINIFLNTFESSHARKYGMGADAPSTVDAVGTKHIKDGVSMNPKNVTHSNGTNGVNYHYDQGRGYASHDEKAELQNKIKSGHNFKHVLAKARELTGRDANKAEPRGPESKHYRDGQHDGENGNAVFRAKAKIQALKDKMEHTKETLKK